MEVKWNIKNVQNEDRGIRWRNRKYSNKEGLNLAIGIIQQM